MKLTKKQLEQKLEALRFTINDSHGAIFDHEKDYGAQQIQSRAIALIDALEQDMTHGAKSIVADCESQVDRATRYVLNIEARLAA